MPLAQNSAILSDMTKCSTCLKDFDSRVWNKQYCSSECSNKYIKSRYPSLGVHTGHVGTIAELVICSDLLKRGFDVFRSISPNSNFDIVGFKNNCIKTFEVRTGFRDKDGKIRFNKKTQDKAEHYAIVIHSEPEEIIYIPNI